jgi:hypothetical protein
VCECVLENGQTGLFSFFLSFWSVSSSICSQRRGEEREKILQWDERMGWKKALIIYLFVYLFI